MFVFSYRVLEMRYIFQKILQLNSRLHKLASFKVVLTNTNAPLSDPLTDRDVTFSLISVNTLIDSIVV